MCILHVNKKYDNIHNMKKQRIVIELNEQEVRDFNEVLYHAQRLGKIETMKKKEFFKKVILGIMLDSLKQTNT
jgi:hypothetical protein